MLTEHEENLAALYDTERRNTAAKQFTVCGVHTVAGVWKQADLKPHNAFYAVTRALWEWGGAASASSNKQDRLITHSAGCICSGRTCLDDAPENGAMKDRWKQNIKDA